MPQWAGSCWYYLRYLQPWNTDRLIDPEVEKYWLPVDLYVGVSYIPSLHTTFSVTVVLHTANGILHLLKPFVVGGTGGAEHAVLHLLYARFWHKVLYDLGVVSTKEPFQRLVSQGMILGEV